MLYAGLAEGCPWQWPAFCWKSFAAHNSLCTDISCPAAMQTRLCLPGRTALFHSPLRVTSPHTPSFKKSSPDTACLHQGSRCGVPWHSTLLQMRVPKHVNQPFPRLGTSTSGGCASVLRKQIHEVRLAPDKDTVLLRSAENKTADEPKALCGAGTAPRAPLLLLLLCC